MKKFSIKKQFLFPSAALFAVAGMLLTACSSDADSTEQGGLRATDTYFMSVDAAKDGDTRALSLDGKTLQASWATTEQVFVKYNDKWFSGYLTSGANAATAWLNGAISGVDAPENAVLGMQYPRQEWSYAGQVGTLADIAAKYDYATAATNITIEGSNISAASSVTFQNQQAIVKFILTDGTNPVCPTALRIAASGLKTGERTLDDVTITPGGATNEIYAALRGVTGNLVLTATTADKIYTYRKTAVTFEHGKYYEVTLPMKEKTYPVTLAAVTPHYVGSVVTADGTVYANAAAATAAGKTAVAMIAYVSSTGHGLALALADEGAQTLEQAQSVTEETAVAGGTWRLPTVSDWRHVFIACGNGAAEDDTSATVYFASLQSKLTAAGGSTLKKSTYWTGGEGLSDYTIDIGDETAIFAIESTTELPYPVRAILAF